MNRRRKLVIALGVSALEVPFGSVAQSPAKMRRIGFLSAGSVESNAVLLDAFRAGMTELRWIENRDYKIDARYANGAVNTLGHLAMALVAIPSDVLIAAGDTAIRALAQNTKTIPIVFGNSSDPVASGFATSLRQPGGNITGLTNIAPDISAKQLQLLKEVIPQLTHVALLLTPEELGVPQQVKALNEAAKLLGVRITVIELRTVADIEPDFKRGATAGAQAYVVINSFIVQAQRQAIAARTASLKLPAIFPLDESTEAGGLMSYSASLREQFRRAASYVVRIFDGAKPGSLPIEQPTKFELVVNLRTAKAMGLQIPNSILVRADRVIE